MMGPNEFALLNKVNGAGFLFPNLVGFLSIWLLILICIGISRMICEFNRKDGFRSWDIILVIFLVVANAVAAIRLIVRLNQVAAYHRIIVDENARGAMIRAIEKDVSEKTEREKIVIVLEKNE